MLEISCHKDLRVWKKSVDLANEVYAATRQLPRDERFVLGDQLRRAALSVASNIAEGSARRSRLEFLQFLHIARGSLAELETQLFIAIDQKLVDPSLMRHVDDVGRMLNGLITSLANARRLAHARACHRHLAARNPGSSDSS